jgi:hypothetical protein
LKRIFLAFIFLSLFSCKDKPKFFVASKVCNGLYREKYRVFSGGAWSAEKYEGYLTDSTTFRHYIGSHDEYGSYHYDCAGDTIIVRKYSHSEEGKKLTEERNFSLAEFKREHEFKDVVSR